MRKQVTLLMRFTMVQMLLCYPGETNSGDYPVEAVETMARIAVRTEEALVDQDAFALKNIANLI